MSSTPCYNAYLSNFCWARLGPRLKCLFHLLPMDQIRLPLHIGYWLDLVFPRLALRPSVCHRNLSKCSSFLWTNILHLSMALLSRYRCWRARLFHGLVFRRNCSTSRLLAPSIRSLQIWLCCPCYSCKKGWLDLVFPILALRLSVCHRNLSKCSSFLWGDQKTIKDSQETDLTWLKN